MVAKNTNGNGGARLVFMDDGPPPRGLLDFALWVCVFAMGFAIGMLAVVTAL